MKLVDLDNVKFYRTRSRGNGKTLIADTVEEVITKLFNGLPTVEAIPVEWIQKYADNMDSFAKYNPVAYSGYAEGAEWIRNMVKNWREEHEND